MKIVIIVGGPAGMIAAIVASKNSSNIKNGTKEVPQILLIEKNEKLGKNYLSQERVDVTLLTIVTKKIS